MDKHDILIILLYHVVVGGLLSLFLWYVNQSFQVRPEFKFLVSSS